MSNNQDAHEKVLRQRSHIPPADPAQPQAPPGERKVREKFSWSGSSTVGILFTALIIIIFFFIMMRVM